MGLRTGPIQEGSQPGPRLDRKARARKDPKAHSRAKANQACTVVELDTPFALIGRVWIAAHAAPLDFQWVYRLTNATQLGTLAVIAMWH